MTEEDIEYPEGHVRMEGTKVGKIVGKFIPETQILSRVGCDCVICSTSASVSNEPLLYTSPEQIEREILDELSMLRQKVADMETAKAFHMACIENIIERVAELERQSEVRDKVLERILNIREGRG